jgi:DNA repair protein RecO
MTAAIREVDALVLRNLRFGDTSRIATLFTAELGKIGVIAKGARDPRSPFGASLEIFSRSSFVVYFRPGRDLQFLKSGSLEREFRGIVQSARRYLFGAAWLEFLDRVVLEEEPAPALFSLAVRGVEVIESAPEGSVSELFRGLELRAAALLGYAPECRACLHCGRPVPEREESPAGSRGQAPWVFLPGEGGVVCPSCAGSGEARVLGIPLSSRGVRRVRAMVLGRGLAHGGGPPAPAGDRSPGPSGSPGMVRETAEKPPAGPSRAWILTLDRLVEEFLRYHVGSYRGSRALEGMPGWRMSA